MTIFLQFYTFEKISNYQSHEKTIIIIRISIMLCCARQGANICRSAYIYFKNSSSNKPLRVIRTFINSVNWLSVQWNNVAESSLHQKKKESNILRFDFLTFANLKIWENSGRPFDKSAVRKQYSAEKFRRTIFHRFDEMANLFIGQMLCPRESLSLVTPRGKGTDIINKYEEL